MKEQLRGDRVEGVEPCSGSDRRIFFLRLLLIIVGCCSWLAFDSFESYEYCFEPTDPLDPTSILHVTRTRLVKQSPLFCLF